VPRLPRQSKTPKPHGFTEAQISARASALWQQRGEDSTDQENWADAIRDLQREQAIRQASRPLRRLWWRTGLGTPLQRMWHWTGIKEKKGWDFLQLLVAPLVLAVIGLGLQEYVKEHDQQVADAKVQQDRQLTDAKANQDRQLADNKAKQDQQLADNKAKQDTLVKYLDQMAESMKDDLLTAKPGDKRFIVAQARTVLALQSLDKKRQHLVIQFLSASGLNDQPDYNWQPRDKRYQLNPLPSKARVLLYRAQLSKANLVNSDLSGAVLVGANLENADLSCNLSESRTLDQCSDLSGTDLRGVDLWGADLSGANLWGANLWGADLWGANLSGADLRGANFSKANLFFANFYDALLEGANLRGADLRSTFFWDADLKSNDFSGANLENVFFQSADFSGADFSGASLRGASLRDSKFSGANFHSADLRGANLSFALLQHAKLSKANLSGAILLNTDLRQATELTPLQLEEGNPPFLCNVALPRGLTVNPNRDCDRLPQVLLERYPTLFNTLREAQNLVNRWRQQKWTDEPPRK